MTLHVFNPEHDMALAADTPHWTSPHAGRELRCDLAWLPVLWAVDGDAVLVADVPAATAAARRQKAAAGRRVLFVDAKGLARLTGSVTLDAVAPWGWDKAIIGELQRCGVPQSLMPDADTLSRQRELSSRQTAAALLADTRRDIAGLCGEAYIIYNVDDIAALRCDWGAVVVKSPWSSSGRGVRYLMAADNADSTLRWAAKVVREQGAVTVERYLNKVEDFAMEFMAEADGQVRYAGLSVFATRHGAYVGSVLATEAEKEELLARRIDTVLLREVRQYLERWLTERIAGAYVGPLGVDMLVAQTDNGLRLNPCVEINLRRTMGHVALALSPTKPGHRCLMQVGREATNYHLRVTCDQELWY